jgi:hypothetical protein
LPTLPTSDLSPRRPRYHAALRLPACPHRSRLSPSGQTGIRRFIRPRVSGPRTAARVLRASPAPPRSPP